MVLIIVIYIKPLDKDEIGIFEDKQSKLGLLYWCNHSYLLLIPVITYIYRDLHFLRAFRYSSLQLF
jgi:hypothetical protein